MKKMFLIAVAAICLTSAASVGVRAQGTEKKGSTVDAWRQALPATEQTTDSQPQIVMEESRNNIEAKETEAQIAARILILERRLLDAFKTRDAAALRELLADDFSPVGVNVIEAQADKARFIELAQKNPELGSYAADKIKVRVFPSSLAVVTSYYKRQTIGGGAATDVDFMATDVWVKRKKQWQVVSHHASQMPTAALVARPAQAKQNL